MLSLSPCTTFRCLMPSIWPHHRLNAVLLSISKDAVSCVDKGSYLDHAPERGGLGRCRRADTQC